MRPDQKKQEHKKSANRGGISAAREASEDDASMPYEEVEILGGQYRSG